MRKKSYLYSAAKGEFCLIFQYSFDVMFINLIELREYQCLQCFFYPLRF